MNPVPREICLRAVWSLQLGHSLMGSSLMDCSNSHSCWQAVQAYSYVGIGTPRNRGRNRSLLATCQADCQPSELRAEDLVACPVLPPVGRPVNRYNARRDGTWRRVTIHRLSAALLAARPSAGL